jgi:membrane-bound ClpP family serine protease
LTDETDDEESAPLVAMMSAENTDLVAIGDVGVAVTNLKPVGQAEFHDRIIDVSADLAFVSAGTPVRVISVDRWRVVVEASGPPPEIENEQTGESPA